MNTYFNNLTENVYFVLEILVSWSFFIILFFIEFPSFVVTISKENKTCLPVYCIVFVW